MESQRGAVMGRRSTDTVDYFPHYTERGRTVYILKSQFGNDGYAFWFQLLELLCSTEGHCFDCRDEHSWQYLLAFCSVNEVSGTEILDLLAKLGKIDKELWKNKLIWVTNLVANLENVYRKRGRNIPQKPSLPVSVTESTTSNPEIHITATEIPQSKAKHSIAPLTPQKGNGNGPTYSDDFLSFWSAYPRRVGKGAAWKAWMKSNGKPPLEEIIQAIKRQQSTDQWRKDGGQYIPNPSTWINQRRWEDEIFDEAEKGGFDV
jgi:hypothetical protein